MRTPDEEVKQTQTDESETIEQDNKKEKEVKGNQ